jgi:Sulfotransferase family
LAERHADWDANRFLDDVTTHPRFLEWGLGRDDVAAELARSPAATSYADGVRAVFRCYADAQGKPRYGDKTPGYVFTLPLLGELFPEARFVQVVRDGRDAGLSIREAATKVPPSARQVAKLWRKAVNSGRAFGATHPDRYAEVRYEDLVDDAERELRRLCPFLHLDFDPAMLDHQASAERLLQTCELPHLHTRLALAPTRRLRDWTVEMDPADVVAFEEVAGDTLRACGYPTAPVPARRRAAAAVRHLRRRVVHRLPGMGG